MLFPFPAAGIKKHHTAGFPVAWCAYILLGFCFAFLLRSAATFVIVNVFYFFWYGNKIIIARFTFKYVVSCVFALFTATPTIFPTIWIFLTSFAILFFKRNNFPADAFYTWYINGLRLLVRLPAMSPHGDIQFFCSSFVLHCHSCFTVLLWY